MKFDQMKKIGLSFLMVSFLALPNWSPVYAGEADVVGVEARKSGNGWSFNVTVLHADAGWDHYADKWDIIGPDGNILGTRVLAHPHDDEQPFTRSISNIEIPESVSQVTIRAHDSVHKYGGKEFIVDLPQ